MRLNGDPLLPTQYPPLFKILFKAALEILKGEQQRVGSGGKEEVIQLQDQFIRYAYNQTPFDSQYWDSSTKPLEYWTRLSHDSNANQIGVCCSLTQGMKLIFFAENCRQDFLHFAI